jgi:hypothetical protein
MLDNADLHVHSFEQGHILPTGVLHTAIGVMNAARRRLALDQALLKAAVHSSTSIRRAIAQLITLRE